MSDISVGYEVSTFAEKRYLNTGTPLTVAKLSLRFTRSIPRDSATSVSLTGLKYNEVICRPRSYRWEITLFPCFWNVRFSGYCSYH